MTKYADAKVLPCCEIHSWFAPFGRNIYNLIAFPIMRLVNVFRKYFCLIFLKALFTKDAKRSRANKVLSLLNVV